jgi:hypothetical protein
MAEVGPLAGLGNIPVSKLFASTRVLSCSRGTDRDSRPTSDLTQSGRRPPIRRRPSVLCLCNEAVRGKAA